MAIGAYGVFTGLVGVFTLTLGAAVFLAAPSRAQNRWLALLMLVASFAHLGSAAGSISPISAADVAGADGVFQVSVLMLPGVYLLFLGALDTRLTRPLGRTGVRWAIVALTALGVAVRLANADPWTRGDGIAWGGVVVFAALAAVNILGLVAAFLLWRQAEPDTVENRQALAYLLAFGSRDTLFVLFFAYVFGALLVLGSPDRVPRAGLLPPTADLLFTIFMAYGILRTRLFDIDVKIKWTLKQSTVAAIFVAVFFAASEGAAAFIESQTNSAAIGIGAAAALVFILVPIQRLAERVADTAMPNVRPVTEMDRDERARIYAGMVHTAWKDGRMDPNERVMLSDLRRQLGLTTEDVEAIELDVARDLDTQPQPS